MGKRYARYELGDLVEFRYNHQNTIRILTGIVVELNTNKNRYKIKVNMKDYWQSEDKLTLLSKVMNSASK